MDGGIKMAEDVKPSEDVKTDKKVKPGAKEGWKKYKWYLIGGGAILALLVLYFLKTGSSGSGASSPATSTDSNVDPATGYLAGSPADTAALGGSGTQATIPGPAGATGATGAPGKAPDLWQIAIAILAARGIHNPTHAQIHTVWSKLEHTGAPKPKPVTPKPPVHKPTPVKKPVHKK